MHKLFGLCCFVGGLLWGAKPVYDWIVLERKINTGYLPSDPTDYIEFLFPILCLGGLYYFFKLKIQMSSAIIAAAFVFTALFHYFETYAVNSDIPYGLLFMLPSVMLLFIGAFSLERQLKTNPHIPKSMLKLAGIFSTVTGLFLLLPFASFILNDEILTPIMVILMMCIGFVWAAIGLIGFNRVQSS